MFVLDDILNVGRVSFEPDESSINVYFEPFVGRVPEEKLAFVSISRTTSQECLEALSYYLFEDPRSIIDMPIGFLCPDGSTDLSVKIEVEDDIE